MLEFISPEVIKICYAVVNILSPISKEIGREIKGLYLKRKNKLVKIQECKDIDNMPYFLLSEASIKEIICSEDVKALFGLDVEYGSASISKISSISNGVINIEQKNNNVEEDILYDLCFDFVAECYLSADQNDCNNSVSWCEMFGCDESDEEFDVSAFITEKIEIKASVSCVNGKLYCEPYLINTSFSSVSIS